MQSSPVGVLPAGRTAGSAEVPVRADQVPSSANTVAPESEATAIPTAPAAAPFRKLRLEISFAIVFSLFSIYIFYTNTILSEVKDRCSPVSSSFSPIYLCFD